MELVETLKSMTSVASVRNFRVPEKDSFSFVFFLCPKLSGKGYRLNENLTGFTVKYGEGLRESSLSRVQTVSDFLWEFGKLGIPYDIKGVMCAGEALTLFPIPVDRPYVPLNIEGIPVVSSYQLAKADLERFWDLARKKPWLNVPAKIRDSEFAHLSNLLAHAHAPDNLVRDFAERVYAEYALEGLWANEEKFGPNPVFLGVENPEIPLLQNSALEKEKRIPCIQLK